MHERRKSGLAFWVTVVALVLALYILSSGPMQVLAFREVTNPTMDIRGFVPRSRPRTIVHRGVWWPRIYAPLDWISRQPCGKPLKWYWSLFPITQVNGQNVW